VRCQLVVATVGENVQAFVRIRTQWANAALQYMAKGYLEQAVGLVTKEAREPDRWVATRLNQWIARHVVDRFDDTIAALVPHYLKLRVRDRNVFEDDGGLLLDAHEQLTPDATVIFAEFHARDRNFHRAETMLAAIPPGRMPLLTEGFSLLLRRVRNLLELEEKRPIFPAAAAIDKLQTPKQNLDRWAPYLDLNAPTLTFPGSDPRTPALSECFSRSKAESWTACPTTGRKKLLHQIPVGGPGHDRTSAAEADPGVPIDADRATAVPFFQRRGHTAIVLWALVVAVNLVGTWLAQSILDLVWSGSACAIASSFQSAAHLEGTGVVARWWNSLIAQASCETTSGESSAMPAGMFGSALILAGFSTAMLAAPFVLYLTTSWFRRYDEIREFFSRDGLYAYLETFWPYRLTQALEEQGLVSNESFKENNARGWREAAREHASTLERVFNAIYSEQYGQSIFIAPFLLLIALTFAASILVARWIACPAGASCTAFFSTSEAAVATGAVAGAYFFVTYDAVRRVRRMQLTVSDMYAYALRFLLSIPLALAIAPLGGGKGLNLAIGFVIAMYPVQDIPEIIARFSWRGLWHRYRTYNELTLYQVRGMTRRVEKLLASEGITSIEALAAVDPVLISMRTGLSLRYVLALTSDV